MNWLSRRVTLFGVLALVLGGGLAAAQTVSTTAGAINGTVTDSTKAVLPGVTVTLAGSTVMARRARPPTKTAGTASTPCRPASTP